MKRHDWTVSALDISPVGKHDECLYCKAKIGQQHAAECVCRTRTVVVRTSIEWVIEVPESWDAEMIELHRNEGSRCVSNDISDIVDMDRRLLAEDRCACHLVRTEYLRDATVADERKCAWPIGNNGEAPP